MLTVKLTQTRLADTQDDGLESCREPGMLGGGQPILLNLTIPVRLNRSHCHGSTDRAATHC